MLDKSELWVLQSCVPHTHTHTHVYMETHTYISLSLRVPLRTFLELCPGTTTTDACTEGNQSNCAIQLRLPCCLCPRHRPEHTIRCHPTPWCADTCGAPQVPHGVSSMGCLRHTQCTWALPWGCGFLKLRFGLGLLHSNPASWPGARARHMASQGIPVRL